MYFEDRADKIFGQEAGKMEWPFSKSVKTGRSSLVLNMLGLRHLLTSK